MINSIIKHRIILILTIIIILAGFIRFYKIDQYPVSLYWDEVSIAVNAKFIAETGKDEYGTPFPLLFKAFNDYKSPGNVYLTTIPVKLFGLNEFSARFIAALLGTILIIVIYFLGKHLSVLAKKNVKPEIFGLICSLLLAISPWHIQFSRSGFEANSGLFFVTLAITLFIIFLNKLEFKYFFSSSFFFAISCYFYRSEFIFAPLFFIFLIFINYKLLFIKKNIIKTVLGIALFSIVLLPFIPPMISEEGMSRGNNVSIFNPANSFEKIVELSKNIENSNNSLLSKAVNNRRVVYANLFIENYISYFKYDFLFKNGDSIERHNVMGMGQFYIWQLPFFLLGVLSAFFLRKKITLIIFGWLLLAAIPAAFSIPASHGLRSLNMLPAYIIVITSGIFIFLNVLPKKSHLIVSIILAFVIFVSFIHYADLYKKSSILYSKSWGDGYRQLFNYVDLNKNEYEKFLVSGHYWQPYAYGLFYTRFDPEVYLKNGSRKGFDKFIFGGTSWENEEELGYEKLREYSKNKNILFALSPKEHKDFRKNVNTVNVIKNHNNEVVFILSEPK